MSILDEIEKRKPPEAANRHDSATDRNPLLELIELRCVELIERCTNLANSPERFPLCLCIDAFVNPRRKAVVSASTETARVRKILLELLAARGAFLLAHH